MASFDRASKRKCLTLCCMSTLISVKGDDSSCTYMHGRNGIGGTLQSWRPLYSYIEMSARYIYHRIVCLKVLNEMYIL